MSIRIAGEIAAYQAAWFICALGAAAGTGVPGLLAAAVFVLLQVVVNGEGANRAVLAGAAALLGTVAETGLAASGLVIYAASWPAAGWAPAWIVGLWLAFGSTIPTTAQLLGRRALPMAVLAGLLLGPLAYAAADRLGALTIAGPGWSAHLAIAAIWGVAFPVLVAMGRRL